MRPSVVRTLAVAAVAVVVLAALIQIFLPPYLADRTADRLEENGGTAEVTLSSFPAVRLLASDGDRIEIRGRGQRLELEEDTDALDRLDGFGEVDVRLTDLEAGPVRASLFALTREEDEDDYRLRVNGAVRPSDLSEYAAEFLGGRLGGLLGDLAGEALPFGDTDLPLELDARVASEDGRPQLVSGSGSVAGLPTGPLTEAILGAVLSRL